MFGVVFDDKPELTDNFFVARNQVRGAPVDIDSYRLIGLDPRIRLSLTHVQSGEKEFIVLRFKYARSHVTPSGHVLTAKVCFLDFSICKHYDDTYTCNKIPNTFQYFMNAAVAKSKSC